MELKKKKKTWRGIQNTEDVTDGDMQDFLDGTEFWAGEKNDWDGSFYIFSDHKNLDLGKNCWLVISSKGKAKVLYSWEFEEEFERK